VGKIGDFHVIFDGNRRISGKRYEIGQWLLWNVNRKSWVPDWMVTFSMNWVTITRGSRSLYNYKSNISNTVRFRDKITKEH